MVNNPPSSTGDSGSIPGRGTKIPHASGQLSPCAATTEPVCSGARVPQLERSPRATTKIPRATTKTRHSQRKKERKKEALKSLQGEVAAQLGTESHPWFSHGAELAPEGRRQKGAEPRG